MKTGGGEAWRSVSRELQRALGLGPLSRAEAEREYAGAEARALSRAEIEAVVRFATGAAEGQGRSVRRPGGIAAAGPLRDEALQLHRNAGELSEEVRARVAQLRREVLDELDGEGAGEGAGQDPEGGQ